MKEVSKRLDYKTVSLLPSKGISATALSPSHFCWSTFCFVSVQKCLLYTLPTAAIHKTLHLLHYPLLLQAPILLSYCSSLQTSDLQHYTYLYFPQSAISTLYTLYSSTEFSGWTVHTILHVSELYTSQHCALSYLSQILLYFIRCENEGIASKNPEISREVV